MKRIMLSIRAGVLFSLILAGGCTSVAEEAKYTVLLKEGDLELRRYAPKIVAETIVDGDFDEVGNTAFRRLFNYISGKNKKSESIPMTAPVSQEQEGVKIPMTAPVNQEQRSDRWSITFIMPSGYTMKTLPVPDDERVQLREVPEQLMAAITYSGTWSRERYERHKAKLLEWMERKGYNQTGEPVYARYNPPFTLWFMRRNEVLIPLREQ